MRQNKENLKELLENLVVKYNTPDFIKDDPIKFPYMFKSYQDVEIAGLIASSLAYGKRDKILLSVTKILEIMEFKPYEYVVNFDYNNDNKAFDGFLHRYTSGNDVALMLHSLGGALREYESLKNMFLQSYSDDDNSIKESLTAFVDSVRKFAPVRENLKGLYFLLPSPEKGSACKRLNMFLRWMVRSGPVDLNLWAEVSPAKLLIPLDTHVAKLSRQMHLTERKTDDWKTAEEITSELREFDSNDPVKYDFAIFGMGVNKNIPDFIL